jgi:phosphoglycerate dehydrogenase-like enzyme
MRIAVLDDYLEVARELADWSRLPPDSELTVFHQPIGDEDALAATLAPFDIVCLMRERTPMLAGLIARLGNLKLIVTTGRRNFSIDIAAANERGIVVSGTPGRHAAPAELAFLHLMALARGLAAEATSMRGGGWQVALGRELSGLTLGLVGLGGLGRQVARFGRAFNMKVIAWSENLTREQAEKEGAELVGKEELFRSADFVEVLVRLSPRTVGLVGASEIALMKPDACLINISRGPIVDTGALCAALEAGRIAGAGLDVYDEEPLPADSPLRRVPNLLLTPHIGYATREAFEVFYPATLDCVLAFLDGKPVNVLGPEAGRTAS